MVAQPYYREILTVATKCSIKCPRMYVTFIENCA